MTEWAAAVADLAHRFLGVVIAGCDQVTHLAIPNWRSPLVTVLPCCYKAPRRRG